MKKLKTLFKVIKNIKTYPTYLKDYFGFSDGDFLIYELRNGIKYIIRGGSTDRFIVNEVWLHKSYTPKGFEINPQDIVVDVGAHIGIFTVLAAKKAHKGKVFCFEPIKENAKFLIKNIKLNNISNVILENKAVSDKKGQLKIYVSKSKNKGQNSIHKLAKTQEPEQVEKISFKDFLKKTDRIDFLKMDCEGSEYPIFYSLNKNELSKIKKISLEYHNYGSGNGEDLGRFLEKNGFKVVLKKEGNQFGTIYAKLIQ